MTESWCLWKYFLIAINYPDLVPGYDEMDQYKNAIFIFVFPKASGAWHIVGVPKYILNIWSEFPGFL